MKPQEKMVLDSGLKLDLAKVTIAPIAQLFGHIILIEGYALPTYTGCHALIKLRDVPGKIVALMTTEVRLQSLLETALATGNLVALWAQKLSNPPTPRGGTWSADVYSIDGVILYRFK